MRWPAKGLVVILSLAFGAPATSTLKSEPPPFASREPRPPRQFVTGVDSIEGAWTSVAPYSGKYYCSAAYDAARNRMIVFGGGYPSHTNDTWVLTLDGDPEWTQLFPVGTLPPARSFHTAVYDQAGDRILVFGGATGSNIYANDIWALSLSGDPQWTEIIPSGSSPPERDTHTAVYDPVGNRMIVFGGRSTGTTRYNDVWSLSLSGAPSWSQLLPSGNLPIPRFAATAVYDAMQQRMVVFGGADSLNTRLNDTWTLDLGGTPAWTELAPGGSLPAPRVGHVATYDPTDDRVVIAGGNGGPTPPQDVWELSLTGSPSWSLISTSGGPASMGQGMAAVYSSSDDEMIIFGNSLSGPAINNTWKLTLSGGSMWSQIIPYDQPPSERYGHTAIYDPWRKRMVMFGGSDGSTRSDVWELALETDPAKWTHLYPVGDPVPPMVVHSAVYDPNRNRMVVLEPSYYPLETWALELGDPDEDALEWKHLEPDSALPGRWGHSAIMDATRDRMIVFGGYDGSGYLNDVWALNFSPVLEWTELYPSGTPPPARQAHTAVYDFEHDQMIIYGGIADISSRPGFRDAWALDLGSLVWSQFPDAPMNGYHASSIYDPIRDRVVVFGGETFFERRKVHNDVFTLSLEGTPTWHFVYPPTYPPTDRSSHTAVYDPEMDRMVVFGGLGGTSTDRRNETYFLLWGTPDPTPRYTLSGAITDQSMNPIPGATVQLLLGSQVVLSTTSDLLGLYSFDVLPGTFTLVVSHPNYLKKRTEGVVVGGDTTVDISLGKLLVSDDAHLPNHHTHWEYDTEHTIDWHSESGDVFSVSVEFRMDAGSPWRWIGVTISPEESFLWAAEDIPDTSSVEVQIRYKAYDSGGDLLGERIGDEFALHTNTSVLIKEADRHVFAWNDIPEGTARFRLTLVPDGLTSCDSPSSREYDTTDDAPYYQLPEQDWNELERAHWTYAVSAVDLAGDPITDVVPPQPFVLCELRKVGNAASSGVPVILLHGWTDSPNIWLPGVNYLSTALGNAGCDSWAFGYPPVGDIEISAAGLERAIRKVLASYSGEQRVRLIARSMGGLVSRAYIQGFARSPSGAPVAYNDDVSHLVTLSTPHLGVPTELMSSLVSDCRSIKGPAVYMMNNISPWDLSSASEFILELNQSASTTLDDQCLYLFAAGDFPTGEGWAYPASYAVLVNYYKGPNDGAVPVTSSLAYNVSGIPNLTTACYHQSHKRIAEFDPSEHKTSDLISFMSTGADPSRGCFSGNVLAGFVGAPAGGGPITGALLQVLVPSTEASLKPDALSAGATTSELVSAAVTDASGYYSMPFLPPGQYELQVSAPGAVTETMDVALDTTVSGWSWDVTLAEDPSYSGPSDPWISINDGAPVTVDSAVTVTAGAEGAVEMQLSESPDFGGASWTAIAPVPWILANGSGTYSIFARFRDASQNETQMVFDTIHFPGSSRGSVLVSSNIAGATIFLDGERIAATTPATIDNLDAGTHTVSLSLSGHRPEPAQIEFEVIDGAQSTADFTLAPRQPPTAFDLTSPVFGGFGTRRPTFGWSTSSDPEGGSAVYYNVQVSHDTAFANIDFEVGGISGNQYTTSLELDDSTTYAWRVRANTVYQISTYCNEPFRLIHIDGTPPAIDVISPNADEVWETGDTVTIDWSAADYWGVQSIEVALSIDGGISYALIGTPGPADSTMTWVVPDTLSNAFGLCKIRLMGWDPASNEGEGLSDGYFSISSLVTGIEDHPDLPDRYTLYQNVPNPFNPVTLIRYDVPAGGGDVSLRIYDVTGRLVRTLVDGFEPEGTRSVPWDGTNAHGRRVASGIYFYRLTAPNYDQTLRMLLLE